MIPETDEEPLMQTESRYQLEQEEGQVQVATEGAEVLHVLVFFNNWIERMEEKKRVRERGSERRIEKRVKGRKR